ncbi:MAG: homoserine dehydrogenase [Candidatus Thermoplasmatota archaeon]|nr:homoserine dehydrogenase [Candidatus Thermoplasmatota archaeon]MBU4144106.1 homoserine dehydrogenase [Candidatus Thermoplasmatota archaeon]MBU4591827.1 homoserine dehydrogenase [Candidatus Thermoplasmatota archaeon]
MQRRIILIGCGVVGQGFLEILVKKKELLEEKFDFEPVLVGVADMMKGSILVPEGIDIPAFLEHLKATGTVHDFPAEDAIVGLNSLDLIKEADAEIMVEVTYTDIKTGEPATSHIKSAFDNGMCVTTTNKGPLTLHFKELTELARKKNVLLRYEGVVMSGTPIFNLLEYCLAVNGIREIKGILNGTTNFMLTKMEDENMSYEDALALAQKLGYAEANPTADVEGFDALAKVVILSNVVLGGHITPDDAERVGISGITIEDIQKAKAEGMRYKLIGSTRMENGNIVASVKPVKLPLSDPLAGVSGAANALTFSTDLSGDVTIQGPGAGKLETGFAIMIDVLNMHREM